MRWFKKSTKAEPKASVPASPFQGGQPSVNGMVGMLASAPETRRAPTHLGMGGDA
ncbi:MAG: hypothetical protein BMS9Abin07_1630 [Acidimicrobiia bacterium]|nr:MAG: hypothetical protein BMS9Abin07_1630 [Acidimicrobiia bacterium]